jgi:hypothetical protein
MNFTAAVGEPPAVLCLFPEKATGFTKLAGYRLRDSLLALVKPIAGG